MDDFIPVATFFVVGLVLGFALGGNLSRGWEKEKIYEKYCSKYEIRVDYDSCMKQPDFMKGKQHVQSLRQKDQDWRVGFICWG